MVPGSGLPAAARSPTALQPQTFTPGATTPPSTTSRSSRAAFLMTTGSSQGCLAKTKDGISKWDTAIPPPLPVPDTERGRPGPGARLAKEPCASSTDVRSRLDRSRRPEPAQIPVRSAALPEPPAMPHDRNGGGDDDIEEEYPEHGGALMSLGRDDVAEGHAFDLQPVEDPGTAAAAPERNQAGVGPYRHQGGQPRRHRERLRTPDQPRRRRRPLAGTRQPTQHVFRRLRGQSPGDLLRAPHFLPASSPRRNRPRSGERRAGVDAGAGDRKELPIQPELPVGPSGAAKRSFIPSLRTLPVVVRGRSPAAASR